MAGITVEYESRIRGRSDLGFSTASYKGKRQHLVTFDAWNREALCGKGVLGAPTEGAIGGGTLCSECAEVAGITANDIIEENT